MRYTRASTAALGEGTYGTVHMVTEEITQKKFAMKKMRSDDKDEGIPQTTLREIVALMRCKKLIHPGVVNVRSILVEDRVKLVMEYFPTTLGKFIHDQHPDGLNSSSNLNLFFNLSQQIVDAVGFCHKMFVTHRDLKPENILYDPETETLKLCDFGLARSTLVNSRRKVKEWTAGEKHNTKIEVEPMSSAIVTLWFRSPEIMSQNGTAKFGDPIAVDIWSVGCVLYFCFTGKHLFPAHTEFEMLILIFQRLGLPTKDIADKYYKDCDWKCFPKWNHPKPPEERFDSIHQLCPILYNVLDEKLLSLDVSKRTLSISFQ